MTKKVKDLSTDEMTNICYNHNGCENCPLNIPESDVCVKSLVKYYGLKELLEKEIEVKNEKMYKL